jgi:predicted transcriptional regulator
LKVFVTNRSPFDFAAFYPHTELKLIGGILKEDEEGTDDRMEEIASLSKVMEVKPILFGNENVSNPLGIAFFSFDELEKIPDRQKLEILLK